MSVTSLTKNEFREKVYDIDKNPEQWQYEGKQPCIVDFYATWCGPCKSLAPVLEEVAVEYAGQIQLYKVDVDLEPDLAKAFGIRSIPTLLFCPLENEAIWMSGVMTKSQLKQRIGELLLLEHA